jgi:hypothetical protein
VADLAQQESRMEVKRKANIRDSALGHRPQHLFFFARLDLSEKRYLRTVVYWVAAKLIVRLPSLLPI